MDPPAPDGGVYVVLMVDTFSKWVEIEAVPNKSALEMMKAMHKAIVCRYGIPTAIRTDKGTEYSGIFADYCEYLGIRQQVISTSHPRANG